MRVALSVNGGTFSQLLFVKSGTVAKQYGKRSSGSCYL